jgi:glucoamylase
VNCDGTLDISNWARPQHDGPPLRLLAVLRWVRDVTLDSELAAAAAALIRADLAFTRGRWRIPSVDIWEEEQGHHYYTLRVAAAALEEGGGWLEARGGQGDAHEAQLCRADAQAILRMLDGFWLAEAGHYRSRVLESGAPSAKELDIAVIFAAIHGVGQNADLRGSSRSHSVHDPRMQATLARLEALFDAEYPLNRNRPASRGPAMGRYRGDVYYSGGAYYFSTLAAAEFCYRAAVGQCAGREGSRVSEERFVDQALMQRGDAFLETVRAFTPPNGDMSEQFDQTTGEQTSAKHLAWSYAAFISCVVARRDANRYRTRTGS